jgi:hypothetical protein
MSPRIRGGPRGLLHVAVVASLLAIAAGCTDENLLSPDDDLEGPGLVVSYGDQPPAGLATVQLGAESLQLWPYTGDSFDGTPVDPINIIFAGQVHPLQLRAALMALDGDRSAFGIPPIPPFDARWTDVVGGAVQTGYTEGPLGWSGSVVQLTLGDFGPLRVHVRLFTTGVGHGGSGTWTVGGAHFEVQIPQTADHQVLSWELAEQIVVVDLIRTGLLDPDLPMTLSGPISAVPSFRTIPAVIYNGLPDDLIALIGGPPKPVSEDVPLANDGQATIFNVAGAVPVEPGTWVETAAVGYDQIVPKPFCADGPGDYMHVLGPVDFETTVEVQPDGRYSYRSSYTGRLEAQPLDLSSGVPVPVGDLLIAHVEGFQNGFLDEQHGRILARDKRLVLGGEGPERLFTRLVVSDRGRNEYREREKCIDED